MFSHGLHKLHGLADCRAALSINTAAVKSAAYQQYAGHNLTISLEESVQLKTTVKTYE